MALSIDELKILIQNDEHRQLELKKTTGELKDGMHSACAFLNTEGGWLFFGVAPTSLMILGQQVTDSTQREIAQALSYMEPQITPENIRQPHISYPYNPLIANVLYSTTYIENWGSGIKRIMEACQKRGVATILSVAVLVLNILNESSIGPAISDAFS